MVNTLVSINSRRLQLVHTIKTKCITFQTVDPDIWPILIFHKLELVFHQILFMIFSSMIFLRKIFLLYSINWPNFVVWLPFPLNLLGNMCILLAIQSVTSKGVTLTFTFVTIFSYMTTKVRTEA